jgi:hypothetical protein
MPNHWLIILSGLVLGLLPPRLFYGSGCRHVTLLDAFTSNHLRTSGDEGGGRRRNRRAWWKVPLYWLDPIRAFASAHIISIGIWRIPQETTEQSLMVLLILSVLTFTIFCSQMELGRQRKGYLLAPIAFFAGYMPGLCFGLEILGLSITIVGLISILASRNVTAGFLLAGGVALIGGVAYLGPKSLLAAIYAVTALAPVPYAFLRKSRLVVPIRA